MNDVKKLHRNTNDKIIGGVCSGIGDYFNTDPTLVRLGMVFLIILSGGVGVIAYLIGWMIIPEQEA